MINITTLKEKDIGKYVVYHASSAKKDRGRIKSWNNKWIFVVYHCVNNWGNYKNYTATATDPKKLSFDEK